MRKVVVKKTKMDLDQLLYHQASKCVEKNEETAVPTSFSTLEKDRLLHELQVHQVELEMQNHELRRIRHELEVSRERYFELFDMAPVSYLTLDALGKIKEANFTVATFLGMTRSTLVNTELSCYIHPEDRHLCCLSHKQPSKQTVPQHVTLRMRHGTGTVFWVELKISVMLNDEYGVIFNDITSASLKKELNKHAEQYRTLIATDLFGFFLLDSVGNLMDVNDLYCTMSGYSRDELLQLSLLDLEAAESTEETAEHVRKLIDFGTDHFESRHRAKNGRIFDVEISTTYLNSQGLVIVFTRDITEKKRIKNVQTFLAEISTGASNQEPFFNSLARYLAKILDMNFVCIDHFEVDSQMATTVAVWNDDHFVDNMTYALKDTPGGDMIGREICCFPEGVNTLFPCDKVLQELHAESYVGMILRSHSGEPIGLIAVVDQKPLENRTLIETTLRMVTLRAAGELERLAAEEALRVSEERLRLATKGAREGIWEWNILTDQVFLSARWCEIVGYLYDDPELHHSFNGWSERIHPDDYERVMKVLADHLERRTNYYDVEFRHRHKSGEYVWHRSRGEVVFYDKGKAVKMFGTLADITERKQLEEQLFQSLKDANSSNATMSRLLRIVAHEFRTPLGLLIGNTDILDRYWERLTPKKRTKHAESIRSAARQMSNLVSSVVSFNQMGTDCLVTITQLIDIAYLCRTIAAEVETVWSAGHHYHIVIADNCGIALLNEILLRRIVENLLTNAFRYTSPDGVVSLHVHRENDRLCLEISDTGIGIPEDDQKLIFDPFYRSRNVEDRRGLGLGLSIVQHALLQLYGTVNVTSNIGEGTTMRVEIPVARTS